MRTRLVKRQSSDDAICGTRWGRCGRRRRGLVKGLVGLAFLPLSWLVVIQIDRGALKKLSTSAREVTMLLASFSGQ
jgi:uncharacterized membrane protein (Fun14 family)